MSGIACINCGRPMADHCGVHVIPCCPGKCPGEISDGDPVEVHPPSDRGEEQAGLNGPSGSPTSPSEALPVPDFLRQAMVQAGVDPDEVARKAAAENVLPSDADEALRQAAAATGTGLRCKSCKQAVDLNDPNMLVEVTGWSKRRQQGGQNHVIDRIETGYVMCGDCSLRLQHLGPHAFAQETLV